MVDAKATPITAVSTRAAALKEIDSALIGIERGFLVSRLVGDPYGGRDAQRVVYDKVTTVEQISKGLDEIGWTLSGNSSQIPVARGEAALTGLLSARDALKKDILSKVGASLEGRRERVEAEALLKAAERVRDTGYGALTDTEYKVLFRNLKNPRNRDAILATAKEMFEASEISIKEYMQIRGDIGKMMQVSNALAETIESGNIERTRGIYTAALDAIRGGDKDVDALVSRFIDKLVLHNYGMEEDYLASRSISSTLKRFASECDTFAKVYADTKFSPVAAELTGFGGKLLDAARGIEPPDGDLVKALRHVDNVQQDAEKTAPVAKPERRGLFRWRRGSDSVGEGPCQGLAGWDARQ